MQFHQPARDGQADAEPAAFSCATSEQLEDTDAGGSELPWQECVRAGGEGLEASGQSLRFWNVYVSLVIDQTPEINGFLANVSVAVPDPARA